MSNADEIGHTVQALTLDTVRTTQDVVIEAVTAWSQIVNDPTSRGFIKFSTVAQVIDSNFDFAERILSSQRHFARRVIAAATPKAEAPKAKATAPKAIEAATPAKKIARAKTRTTEKKAPAVRRRPTAAK